MSTYENKFVVVNVDKDDFTAFHGGEPYTLTAGETRQFPKFIAEHIAKHLVDKILQERHNQKHTSKATPLKQEIFYKILPWKEEEDLLKDKDTQLKRQRIDTELVVKRAREEISVLKESLAEQSRKIEQLLISREQNETPARKPGRPPKAKEETVPQEMSA